MSARPMTQRPVRSKSAEVALNDEIEAIQGEDSHGFPRRNPDLAPPDCLVLVNHVDVICVPEILGSDAAQVIDDPIELERIRIDLSAPCGLVAVVEAVVYPKLEDEASLIIVFSVPDEIRAVSAAPTVRTGLQPEPHGMVPPLLSPRVAARDATTTAIQRASSLEKPVGMTSLPPLLLLVGFAEGYPYDETTAPVLALSSSWLPASFAASLAEELLGLWREAPGQECLFEWITHIEEGVPAVLDRIAADGVITFMADEYDVGDVSGAGWSASCSSHSAAEARSVVVAHAAAAAEHEQRECPLCLETLYGRDFAANVNCGHRAACFQCTAEMCQLHIVSGTVDAIRCAECDESFHPQSIAPLVATAELERFERLQLSQAIDGMSDMHHCPACGHLASRESAGSNFAVCPECRLGFCVLCASPWHDGPCGGALAAQIEALENRVTGGGKSRQKHQQDDIKLRQKLKQLKEKSATHTVLLVTTKTCPGCRKPVSKVSGCNKMTCICGTKFCWICLKDLSRHADSYQHFRESPKCGLFDNQYDDRVETVKVQRDRIRVQLAEAIEVAKAGREPGSNVICPHCKQMNFRFNRENKVKCWNCPTVFCAVCRKKLKGPKEQRFHFGKSRCPQHWRPPPIAAAGALEPGGRG